MRFCSLSFPSVYVGSLSARGFRVLMTPSLCSSGWWESNSKYRFVRVDFLYSSRLRLLSSSVCTAQSKEGGLSPLTSSLTCELDVIVHRMYMFCEGFHFPCSDFDPEMMKYTYVHSRMSMYCDKAKDNIFMLTGRLSYQNRFGLNNNTVCYIFNWSLCDPFMMLSVASVLYFNLVLLIVFKQLHKIWWHVGFSQLSSLIVF